MNSLGKLWKGGHHGDLVDLGMFLGDLARYKNLLWWWGDGKMESIGKLWKGGHHGDFVQHAIDTLLTTSILKMWTNDFNFTS